MEEMEEDRESRGSSIRERYPGTYSTTTCTSSVLGDSIALVTCLLVLLSLPTTKARNNHPIQGMCE